MKTLDQLRSHNIKVLFTDIDGTLTENGQLRSDAYAALWELKEKGIHVVPVTGRPAGWCEMIARFWPVRGVIGENGALYFCYQNNSMKRQYVLEPQNMLQNRRNLDLIAAQVLKEVKGTAVASDQFCRVFDLAIDFAEDVKPLGEDAVQKIVNIFEKHGAVAKVSHIHVNGWFGDYTKISMCKTFLENELSISVAAALDQCAFVGDSPNDEPSFEFFPLSFGVANIVNFQKQMKHLPTYVASKFEGSGFCEIANRIISLTGR